MLPWHWNILKMNFTLMASPYVGRYALIWRNHMHTSFLFWLLSFINAFQYYIRFIWSFNRYHFQFKSSSRHHSWERYFTYLTFEFCEVVSLYNLLILLFYLTIYPCFQTFYMHSLTWPFAITWRNQKIINIIFFLETKLTGTCYNLWSIENTIELTQKNIF